MAYLTRGLWTLALICLATGASFAAKPTSAPAVPTPPVPAPALPTAADVRQLFTDGKYSEVVRSVSKIVTSREWQAEKPDAYDLYMIKGEAHLHQKENALAAAAFESAAKIASDKVAADQAIIDKGTKEKPADQPVIDRYNAERAEAGVARSTAYLIKHSVGTYFIPKATANQRVVGGNPNDHVKIDILSADSRKTALTAVWTDEKNAITPAVTQASDLDSKSMQAVLAVAKELPSVRDFDFAANGNDDDSGKIAQTVSEHGRDLLQELLDKMLIRLDVISGEALTVETSRSGLPNGGYVNRWHKHGLEGNQASELKKMMKDVSDISSAAKSLNEGLSPEKGFFDKLLKDAKKIKDQADMLLTTDYSQSYINKESAMKKGA